MKKFVSVFLAFLFSSVTARAATPKLVVLIVGDQVRADYLERFHKDLAPGGLRRFRDQGSYYLEARVDHAVTKTGPGHVLVGSGLYAAETGIVANQWYNRTSSRTVSATELIPGGKHVRLRWFAGISFAERLHKARPKSRMVSVSLTDLGALLLGGPDQDEAYWFDHKTKEWTSYHPPSDWLTRFNHRTPPKQTGAVEARPDGVTEELAEEIVSHWQLGRNPSGDPDVLTVSFSGVDVVGHPFGPDSQEMHEAFLRLDQAVSRLMRRLEKTVGPNIVYAFAADHGVTPFPEVSTAKGLEAGRVSFPDLPDQPSILAVSEPWAYTTAAPSEALTRYLAETPGVDAVYTAAQIKQGLAPAVILRSYYPGRCGDLWVVLKPRYIFSSGHSGTTHGQPTDDDQRVPMGFYGPGFPARTYPDEESVSRIASILFKSLGL